MRRIIILLVMLVARLSVNATPFLAEGKTWSCYCFLYFYKEHHFGFSHEEGLRVEGKEDVNGKEYHLVCYELMTYDSNTSDWDYASISSNRWGWEPGYVILHMREAGGRVYVLKEDYLAYWKKRNVTIAETVTIQAEMEDEVLLYDFSLEVGDTYPFMDGVTVVEKGELYNEGLVYNYQLLSDSLLIVEGVGCVNSWGGVVAYQFTPVFYVEGGYVSGMGWVVVNDSNGKIFEYSPNVDEDMLLNISDMSGNNLSISAATYDLYGRRVTGTPQRGIYIRNGRKIVIE